MSTLVEPRPAKNRNFNLRAYLAGGTAGTAFIVGAVIVFGALAGYVGFNGLPVGGDGAAGTAVVGVTGSEAPEAVAAALFAAPAAVAAIAAAPTALAPAPGGPGTAAGGGGGDSAGAPGDPPSGSPESLTAPTDFAAPAAAPPAATDVGGSSGPVGDIVDGVDNVGSDLGADLPLGDATDPITAPVDDVLNGVDAPLGNPNLGDQVGGL